MQADREVYYTSSAAIEFIEWAKPHSRVEKRLPSVDKAHLGKDMPGT